MTTRTRRETVHFRHPFRIKGIDRQLAPGAYEIVSDEEMIEGLSFPCFRRVATMIMVPGAPPQRSAMEMISISSRHGGAEGDRYSSRDRRRRSQRKTVA
jgi:hypothetical protein